jgi:site-specific DNA recombinase
VPLKTGLGSRRAILYARVSTDEQARSGYSLAQQMEALREYAAREGYEVLEEVRDPGQSGASLERPWDGPRARPGGCWRRFGGAGPGPGPVSPASPPTTTCCRREFEEHGTKIRASTTAGTNPRRGNSQTASSTSSPSSNEQR